jgi:putative phosphoesterase
MIIGILSDSHGRAPATSRAVAALVEAGASTLIHLGDVGTEAVIDELVGYDARIVFGNCDLDERSLGRYAELVGVSVDHPVGEMTVDGTTIVYTHGHLDALVADALYRRPDFLLLGHTHVVRDEQVGAVRVVNPGALFRAPRYTAALLDPRAGRLRILEIEKD